MMTSRRFVWTLLVGVAGCLAAAPAVRAQVQDEAHLFSPEAIKKANQRIEEFRKRFGKGLILATFKTPPEEQARAINFDDARMRKKFFNDWIERNSAKAHLDGIYVLICEKPMFIQMVVSPPETEQVFTSLNQRRLRELLIDRLQPANPNQGLFNRFLNSVRKKRKNDDGLLAAVDYVEEKLDYNRPVDRTNWLLSLGTIGVVLGFWSLLVLVRARLRKRTPAAAGVGVEDESGRSIAVLGGGIGAVSGQWLFDKIFRRRKQPAAAAAGAVDVEDLPGEP